MDACNFSRSGLECYGVNQMFVLKLMALAIIAVAIALPQAGAAATKPMPPVLAVRASVRGILRRKGRENVTTRQRRLPLRSRRQVVCPYAAATASVAGNLARLLPQRGGGTGCRQRRHASPAGPSPGLAIRGGVSRFWCFGLRRCCPASAGVVGSGLRDCALPGHAGSPRRTGSASPWQSPAPRDRRGYRALQRT